MNKLCLAATALAIATLLPSVTSCSSDPNPFDVKLPQRGKYAKIQIKINVEETRAGDLSTAEEKEIKKVTVHVFDANETLETTKTVNVTSGANTVDLEVTYGLKTLYVVSAQSNVNPSVGTSLTEYEKSTFNSSLGNIKTNDGFVMVGKSSEQYVVYTASKENLPESNVFNIKLVRLVAKAQVKTSGIDGSSFGISFGASAFKACQLSERMRVVHNGSDVFDNYADSNNNGTYDNYTINDGNNYLDGVSDDFTAAGCAYMPENIVSKPVSGNTTYLCVRFATTPEKYYTFNPTASKLEIKSDTPKASTSYFAVGILDRKNGLVDYVLDNSNHHIVTFNDEVDASVYSNSLNNGSSSAITVSQTDSPLRVATVTEEDTSAPQYEVVKFERGYVYYRVNIAHLASSGDSEKNQYKVMRNKFYKVNLNSIKSLGFSSEQMLRPENPETLLDVDGHTWISASITVAEWDEINQNVDLQ